MKFNFSKPDKSKLDKLLLFKDMNIASNEAIFQFFFENLSYKEFNNYLGLDLKDKENIIFNDTYFKDGFKKLDESNYINEEYAKLLNGIQFKDKEYTLSNLILKKNLLIPFEDINVKEDNYYIEKTNVGYFDKDFSYLAISKDDVVWMSLDPSEINTMRPVAPKFEGDVLVFGLGLGYFPYLLLDNKKVTSITIIEKDPNIIKLYKDHIYPHVKHDISFNIIEDDAYSYIKNNNIDKYDFIYADIWHNPEDGLPLYHKFLTKLKDHPNTYYWLETSLIAMFRRMFLTVIQEELEGLKDKDFNKVGNELENYLKLIHFKYKNKVFNTYDELHNFLSNKNMKDILTNL